MLPLASCVMFHFEKELFSETLRNWRMLVHLIFAFVGSFRVLYCNGPKIDLLDGRLPVEDVPINVRSSIFNGIPPIWDWWILNVGHLNDGHRLLRTQAWAITAKDGDVAFFQWIIAWYVRKKIGVGKFWNFLHSRNAGLDSGGTMWWRNCISPDTTKRGLLWVNGYFRLHFTTVNVEQIVHFPH